MRTHASPKSEPDPPEPRRSRGRSFAMIVGAWTAVGLFFFSQDVSRSWYWQTPLSLGNTLLMWLASVWLLAALTPLILWLGRRWPLDAPRGRRLRHAAMHLLFGVAIASFHVAVVSAFVMAANIMGALTPQRFRVAVGVMAVLALHGNVLSYWVVIAAQHASRIRRLARERERAALRLQAHAATLEAQLSGARLSALKAQLQPHFLFNTLNAIAVLVRQRQVELAEETLARFSDLLRLVLDDVDANEVSLRRELDYTRRYLAIEQLRFADRLRVEIDVAPALLDVAVPHLGLQPLVENAVRHGIGQRVDAGLIRVTAREQAGALHLEVLDDGPGPRAAAIAQVRDEGGEDRAAEDGRVDIGRSRSRGIGLENTRARLRQLYGERAGISLAAAPGGGAIATLRVPMRPAVDVAS